VIIVFWLYLADYLIFYSIILTKSIA